MHKASISIRRLKLVLGRKIGDSVILLCDLRGLTVAQQIQSEVERNGMGR